MVHQNEDKMMDEDIVHSNISLMFLEPSYIDNESAASVNEADENPDKSPS